MCALTFTVLGYMYGPVDDTGIIRTINVDTSMDASPDLGTTKGFHETRMSKTPNPTDATPNDDYGFTEVIIANLAKVKDLLVISRTSVMRYKDTNMSLKEIAEELNVANILEGSIQRTCNTIRVVGQLIETRTDSHLWSETYDSNFDNIFSIQTSIATEIASALRSKITENEKSVKND